MEISKSRSFFQDLKLREIDGYRVMKRPYMGNDLQDSDPIGALVVEHIGEPLPPMALSFCQTNKNAHILALTDELDYITLFNTREKFPGFSSYRENAGRLNQDTHRFFSCTFSLIKMSINTLQLMNMYDGKNCYLQLWLLQRMMEYKSQSEIWCKQGSHV